MKLKTAAIVILIVLLGFSTGFSQPGDSLHWWEPATNTFAVVEGQGWPNEVKAPYDRLPARAEKIVRQPVWNLSRNATGLIIRFKTTAKTLTIKYTVKGSLNAPHFSTTGVSGLDLYSVGMDGEWNWAPGTYKFGEKPGDTINYSYTISKVDSGYKRGREYLLYLPIYNTVGWLSVGHPGSAIFEPLPARAEKPIAIYGTSITQGACASRPGMAWPAIVGRRLDYPVINLGFSGNGTLDEEMIILFAELDAKMYVLDCLGNMMGRFPREEVKRRIVSAVNYLQSKRPGVPIVLPEFGAFNEQRLDQTRGMAIEELNDILKEAFTALEKSGVPNIYLLTAEEMNMGMDDAADYGHPSDLGLTHYADAFERIFRNILHLPAGSSSTTVPRRQYRNDETYNWRELHQQLLKGNKTSAPGTIFLGSEAVQNWPASLMAKDARNLGFKGDRIENILWRVQHAELDDYQAKHVVIMPGSDNLDVNTDAEIITGMQNLIAAIKTRQPNAKLILLGMLPQQGFEKRIKALNVQLQKATMPTGTTYADPGRVLLQSSGNIDTRFYAGGHLPVNAAYMKLCGALKAQGINL